MHKIIGKLAMASIGFSLAALATTGAMGHPTRAKPTNPDIIENSLSAGFPAKLLRLSHISDEAVANQKKYRRDKDELTKALVFCRESRETCIPHLSELAQFIDATSALKDPMAKVLAVQSYINLRITYDFEEANIDEDDLDHYSLLQTFRGWKGICDEQARAKAALMEMVGIPSADLRVIVEDLYYQNTKQDDGHAIAVVRINGKVWALNNQSSDVYDANPSVEAEQNALKNVSEIELFTNQFNAANTGHFNDRDENTLPIASFNSVAAEIISIEPRTIRTTQKTYVCFPAPSTLPSAITHPDNELHFWMITSFSGSTLNILIGNALKESLTTRPVPSTASNNQMIAQKECRLGG